MDEDFDHLITERKTPSATPPPPAPPKEWYHQRLLRIFGWRFLVFLCVTQCVLKGLTMSVVSSLALPLFKQLLGADAATLQLALLVVELPWSVKPLFGLLADLVRIGGYHNRYWLLTSLAIGSGCASLCLVLITSSTAGGAWAFILALMGIHFEIALYDLLSEGCYSARMRDNPDSGSDVVNFVQYLQLGGGIVARILVGPLADTGRFTVIFAILIGICVAPLLPTLVGWLPEERHAGPCVAIIPPQHGNRGMIMIIAFTGCAAPIVTLLANLWDPAVGAAAALLLVCSALVGAFFLFPPILARVALFQALTTLSAPQLGSALDYFYTADEACLAGGPHFSYAYYMSVAGVVGSAASLAGALLYQLTLSKMRFRTVF